MQILAVLGRASAPITRDGLGLRRIQRRKGDAQVHQLGCGRRQGRLGEYGGEPEWQQHGHEGLGGFSVILARVGRGPCLKA